MRKLFLLIMILVIFGTAGCATMANKLFQTEQIATFYISVTSEPSGADIYINNNFAGTTPSGKLPLMVRFIQSDYGLGVHQTVTEQYSLRVSKRGYKDAGMIIPVKNKGFYSPLGRVDEIGLYQTAFNFKLEPISGEIKEESHFDLDEDYNVNLEHTDQHLEGEI